MTLALFKCDTDSFHNNKKQLGFLTNCTFDALRTLYCVYTLHARLHGYFDIIARMKGQCFTCAGPKVTVTVDAAARSWVSRVVEETRTANISATIVARLAALMSTVAAVAEVEPVTGMAKRRT